MYGQVLDQHIQIVIWQFGVKVTTCVSFVMVASFWNMNSNTQCCSITAFNDHFNRKS